MRAVWLWAALAVLLAGAPARADFITYPKSWSTNEVLTAGDLNAQFAAIAAAVNGNLDNGNLKSAAAIYGTKLADAPNGVPGTKINDGAITNAKVNAAAAIEGTKLADAPNGVPGGKINDGAITDAKVNAAAAIMGTKLADAPNGLPTAKINDSAITIAKMAKGASGRAINSAGVPAGGPYAIGTFNLVNTPQFTSAGTPTMIFGYVEVSAENSFSLLTGTATISILRCNATFGCNPAPIYTQRQELWLQEDALNPIKWPLTFPIAWVDGNDGATTSGYYYRITLTTNSNLLFSVKGGTIGVFQLA